jgi:hypothetical protein
MTPYLSRLLFEHSLLTPFWSAWWAGFVVIGEDGAVYLTAAGQTYLEEIDR